MNTTTQADVLSLVDYKHDLAIKLWREHKFDEARPLAREAIEGAQTTDKRLGYTNTLSIIERSAGNLSAAIQLINAALPEAMELKDEFRLAKLHLTQGNNYILLADAHEAEREKKKDEQQREKERMAAYEARQHALIHFSGAIGFFKKLNDARHVIMIENNLADVLVALTRNKEALEHLKRAVAMNGSLTDRAYEDDIQLLQIYETRAKAKMAESKTVAEANEALGDALQSCYGLQKAAETTYLKTSRKTLELCLQRVSYLEESEFLQAALDKVDGHPKMAADLVQMNHGTFIRLCDRHPELRRQPKKKPRGRNCKSSKPA